MSQENAAAKARHYLSEGRLTVRQVDRSGVVAVVCGHSGLVYRVEPSPDLGGWLCNCPAHIDQCAHLTALRLGHGRQPEENRVTNERCPDCAEPSPRPPTPPGRPLRLVPSAVRQPAQASRRLGTPVGRRLGRGLPIPPTASRSTPGR